MEDEKLEGKKFMLGVNYWSSKSNIGMWKKWNESEILKDIVQLGKLGNRVLRIFLLNEDFVDNYGAIKESSIEKLELFLKICEENNQKVFVTFLVGHMSGRNWFIPWASDGDIFSNKSLVGFTNFVGEVVKRIGGYNSIAGWIMSNEMSIVKEPERKEDAIALERTFYGTVRNLDKNRLISSGEVISFLQEPPNIAGNSDYSGLHIYLYDNNKTRHRFTYGALLNIYSNDHSVQSFLEEFGFSTNQITEESQANFTYEMLWTSFTNDSLGAIIWCSSDFDNFEDPPYDWRLIELNFGIMNSKREPKKSGIFFKQFSQELSQMEEMGINIKYKKYTEEASVLIPFFAYEEYTSIDSNYRRNLFNRFPNSFTSALQILKSHSINSSAFYENDIDSHIKGKKFLLIPCVPTLRSTTWKKLLEAVKSRNLSLFVSTFRGIKGSLTLNNFHESFTKEWKDLFGVKNILEAGERGKLYKGKQIFTIVTNFGNLKGGDQIEINFEDLQIYTYPIETIKAQVLIADSQGNAILTYDSESKTALSIIPFELLVSINENIEWVKSYGELIDEIVKRAGIIKIFDTNNINLESQIYSYKDESIFISINHGNEDDSAINLPASGYKKIGGNSEIIRENQNKYIIRFPPGGVIIMHKK